MVLAAATVFVTGCLSMLLRQQVQQPTQLEARWLAASFEIWWMLTFVYLFVNEYKCHFRSTGSTVQQLDCTLQSSMRYESSHERLNGVSI